MKLSIKQGLFMNKFLTVVLFSFCSSAFADVAPTDDPRDFGIAIGALHSKVFKVKAGNYPYAVIAAETGDGCNPVETIVSIEDDEISGDPMVEYLLKIVAAEITGVKADNKRVIIDVRQADGADCTRTIKASYAIEYPGNAGKLSVKKVK
jgi:hypothetical protein